MTPSVPTRSRHSSNGRTAERSRWKNCRPAGSRMFVRNETVSQCVALLEFASGLRCNETATTVKSSVYVDDLFVVVADADE